MQNKNTPTEGQNSDKLEAESALRDAACSPSSLLRQRVVVRIETIDRESGKTIAAENHPYEFDCPLFDCAGGDKIHVTTLGRVVAATVASLATELQQRALDSPGEV